MMLARRRAAPAEPQPPPSPSPNAALGDLRFRALLGEAAWSRLSPAVRRRFSKRLAGGATAIYVGEVAVMRMSRTGWIMAQLFRLIGGPLPTSCDTGLPSVVSVTEDGASGGQVWTRLYARRRGFPQIIHSCKRFAGTSGLEEQQGALVFRSAGYFWHLGALRLNLPAWLSPGALTVVHRETGERRFAFDLDLVHRYLGHLLHQSVAFEETLPWHI
jgi:hypothetical protein